MRWQSLICLLTKLLCRFVEEEMDGKKKLLNRLELFEDPMEEIVQESGAKHLEFELWDDADRSKIIFEELGIDVTDGEWQYDC